MSRQPKSLPWGFVLASGFFLAFGLTNLSLPGPYPDEVIQAAPAAHVATRTLLPATAAVSASNFVFQGQVWPLMTLSYLGPIKIYLLAASFAIFGVSIEVTRVTTLMIGYVGLVALYAFARRALPRSAAEVAVLLVGFDTSFILLCRDDWGPIAFAFAAKMIGLYCALLAWQWPKSRVAPFLCGLAFGLGMAHKADFAWLLLALVPVGLVLFGWHRRLASRASLFAVSGFLLGAAPLLFFNLRSGWATWTSPGAALFQGLGTAAGTPALVALASLILHNFDQRWPVLLLVLDGRGVSYFIAGTPVANYPHLFSALPILADLRSLGSPGDLVARLKLSAEEILCALAAIAIVVAAAARSARSHFRAATACAALAVLVFAQILITPQATGPHHSVAIYPFPQLFVAFGLSVLPSPRCLFSRMSGGLGGQPVSWANRIGLLSWGVYAGLILIVLGADAAQMAQFERQLVRSGGSGYWSDAIDRVATDVQKNYPGQGVETLDWGLRNQLEILLGPAAPVGVWLPADHGRAELDSLLDQGQHLYLIRSPDWALFKDVRARFVDQLGDPEIGPVRREEFPDRVGSVNLELVDLEGPPHPSEALISEMDQAAVVPPAGDVPPIGIRSETIAGITHQAILQHPTSRISFPVSVTPSDDVRFSIGIDPTCQSRSAGATFVVEVDSGVERREVFRRVLRPASVEEDRRWVDGSVNLSPWQGQRALVSFITEPVAGDYTCAWALWGDPIITRGS